jgi:AcrR family transcriptional regulator
MHTVFLGNAEVVERDHRRAPARSSDRDPRCHLGAGDRRGLDLDDDVAHCPENWDRAGNLYKYFPDVEAILLAWHQRHIEEHLAELTQIKDRHSGPLDRLRGVLMQYATIAHRRGIHATDLMTLLHRDQQVNVAERQVERVIRDLLTEAAGVGDVRSDVDPEELARYCLHALLAASSMPSKAAVERLVAVTLSGLHTPS